MNKLFKLVQEMYPDKTDEERIQQLEQLVKQDVLKPDIKNDSCKTKTYHTENFVITTKLNVVKAITDLGHDTIEEDAEYLPTCQQHKFKLGDNDWLFESLFF